MKAVIFDIDDTLYDQIVPFKNALRESLPQVSKELENKLYAVYIKFRYYSDKVFHLTEEGSLSLDDMRVYRIKEALKDFDRVITTKEAKYFQKTYRFNQGKLVIKEEMIDLITELQASHITLGILTNGPTDHQKAKIKQLGLTHIIPKENIFISGELGLAKPNREVFQHIETCLEKTNDQLIYIGDSYENDVVGAKSSDWTCIWLNKYGKDIREEAIQPDIELVDDTQISQVIMEIIK